MPRCPWLVTVWRCSLISEKTAGYSIISEIYRREVMRAWRVTTHISTTRIDKPRIMTAFTGDKWRGDGSVKNRWRNIFTFSFKSLFMQLKCTGALWNSIVLLCSSKASFHMLLRLVHTSGWGAVKHCGWATFFTAPSITAKAGGGCTNAAAGIIPPCQVNEAALQMQNTTPPV